METISRQKEDCFAIQQVLYILEQGLLQNARNNISSEPIKLQGQVIRVNQVDYGTYITLSDLQERQQSILKRCWKAFWRLVRFLIFNAMFLSLVFVGYIVWQVYFNTESNSSENKLQVHENGSPIHSISPKPKLRRRYRSRKKSTKLKKKMTTQQSESSFQGR